MGKAKPDDAATSAPGSKLSPVREQPDMDKMDKERRRIIAEHIATLKAVLRRLLNKLH